MPRLQIMDTTIRDGQQSLWATRMQIGDMLPILPKMDRVGYWAIEAWGGATFDSCLRYLGEDPWQRLRDIRKAMPDTKLQMLLRGQNLLGYKHYHDDVVEKFVELSIKNGIDILRIFDALNDFRNIATALEATKKYATKNTVASGCISYTQSPVHTVEKYVEMCKELKNMGFDTICLKDMAGTMSPYEAEHLIKGIKDAVGDVPLILHTHCTTGMAYMTVTKAIESGIDVIDCATSCFSNGTSQPATESLVATLKGTPRDTGLDLNKMSEAAVHFRKVAERLKASGALDPKVLNVDTNTLLYQVPGGMLSNLLSQLKQAGAEAVLLEVLPGHLHGLPVEQGEELLAFPVGDGVELLEDVVGELHALRLAVGLQHEDAGLALRVRGVHVEAEVAPECSVGLHDIAEKGADHLITAYRGHGRARDRLACLIHDRELHFFFWI